MSRPSKQGSHPGERKKTEPRARDLVKCGQVDDSVGTGAKSCEPPWKTVWHIIYIASNSTSCCISNRSLFTCTLSVSVFRTVLGNSSDLNVYKWKSVGRIQRCTDTTEYIQQSK